MAKQKNYQPSRYEQNALIVSTSIIVVFLLFVAIATSGSLSYYTIPHAILALALICILFFLNTLPKVIVRLFILLAIVGALVAVGIALAYLSYYSQYLEYSNRIEN